MKKPCSPLIGIETFSGAGGMSLGLIEAGIDVRFAFDIDSKAVDTYRTNISDHCHVRDIRHINGREIFDIIGLDEIDVLSGGPPCQGFSKQRKGAHLGADERNDLVREYARLIEEVRPRSFIFENVQVFGQKRGRELIDFMKEQLSEYQIYRFFVYASDFGLAQRRSRFLMIGIRKDVSTLIPVLGMADRIQTVRDAIGDLPPPPEDHTEHKDFPNHIKCRITPLNEQRFRHVPQGGGWLDIPEHLRLNCHNGVDRTKGGWPDVYGRLEWNGQAPTITAGFDSFTRGRYGHPEQHRSLTLREGARLQGFPDDFRFCGTRYDVRLQIGNAVPPPLASAVGKAIIRVLKNDGRMPRFPVWPEGFSQILQAAE
ncbi:DNA cytosine methyltransferase [Brucella intermedia]|uniref:DNA cytosine methyltransferase n=1 Tax=Brucella intermedia TaxID=94625 RepID=UPI000EFCBCA1|nr:DNA cytosine methyltransferase [Brucella intermedia]KAB2720393.1 DNA cytosine methyltransferase [Brucella intermedia]